MDVGPRGGCGDGEVKKEEEEEEEEEEVERGEVEEDAEEEEAEVGARVDVKYRQSHLANSQLRSFVLTERRKKHKIRRRKKHDIIWGGIIQMKNE